MEVPLEPFTLRVHVSHHGERPVQGRIEAAWIPAGSPVPERFDGRFGVAAPEARPFELSPPVTISIDPPQGTARLALQLVDGQGAVVARSFVDAAPVEPLNRRGARPGEG